MSESERKLKELQNKISSGNNRTISSAILSLRNEDPFRGAIGLLIELFDRSNDMFIKDLVRNFLNDMKESSARSEIVAEIQKKYKTETTSMIIASCWQSGLDYSDYTMDFLKAFASGDYIVALECFTVLEESSNYISGKKRDDITEFLNKHKNRFSGEKTKLLEVLIEDFH